MKRFFFWIILALFAGLTVWWIGYVPYNPLKLYQAMPAEARLVSTHEALGGRWDSLVANPLVRTMCLAQGMKAPKFDKFAADPRNRLWAQKLAGRRSVIAYVPRLGSPPEPSWVFATWVGGASQRLRWNLLLSRSSDLDPVHLLDGTELWVVEGPTNSTSSMRLSLALAEGVLLGCWSKNPVGVRYLLDNIDRASDRDSLSDSQWMDRAAKLGYGPGTDRGWIAPGSATPGGGSAPLLTFSLQMAATGAITGTIRADVSCPALASRPYTNRVGELESLLHDVPALAFCMPWDAWQVALNWSGMPSNWVSTIQDCLGTLVESPDGTGRVGLFLLRNEYSARINGPFRNALSSLIRGVKTPVLLIAVEMTNGVDSAQGCVSSALDRVNAQWGCRLIPHPLRTSHGTMILIEETRSNFYGRFDQEERMACAALDHWLLFCSNAGILRRILEREEYRSADRKGEEGWASGTAGGWVNMAAAQETLRDLLGVVSITTAFAGGARSEDMRRDLAVGRAALRAIQGLKSVSFQVEADPAHGGVRIPFAIEAGPSAVNEN